MSCFFCVLPVPAGSFVFRCFQELSLAAQIKITITSEKTQNRIASFVMIGKLSGHLILPELSCQAESATLVDNRPTFSPHTDGGGGGGYFWGGRAAVDLAKERENFKFPKKLRVSYCSSHLFRQLLPHLYQPPPPTQEPAEE